EREAGRTTGPAPLQSACGQGLGLAARGAPQGARRLGRSLPLLRLRAAVLRRLGGGPGGFLPAVRRRAPLALPLLRGAHPQAGSLTPSRRRFLGHLAPIPYPSPIPSARRRSRRRFLVTDCYLRLVRCSGRWGGPPTRVRRPRVSPRVPRNR